jgi:hypothetical protein
MNKFSTHNQNHLITLNQVINIIFWPNLNAYF